MADPITWGLIAMGGSSLLSVGSQMQAGNIAVQESELQAKGEELAAIQREADRKEALSKALSSSIAGAGASGIKAFSGSPLAILQEDIKAEATATERDKFNSKFAANTYRSRGAVKRTQSRIGAGISLMNTAFSTAKVWPSSGTGTTAIPQMKSEWGR